MVNMRWLIRDRTLQALLVVALLLLGLVPVISSFSMRQTQEMAVTLSLSFVSFILLVYSLLLGSTMLWRDLERRYSYAVLSLPIDRGTYVVAKYCSIVIFLAGSAVFTGICSAAAIWLSRLQYPSALPVQWGMITAAFGMELLKYILFATVVLLTSTVATSFFMPFFSGLAIFLAGSSSQDVYEFVSTSAGQRMPAVSRLIIKTVYYLIPNFGAFDFKLQAVYPIPFDAVHAGYVIGYFLVYTSLALSLAIWVFSRREVT
jgi:ABC-type transport system involved in multi-copper enzyme maturation permease subunit